MAMDFILEEARVLVREDRVVWTSYNHDRIRKVFTLIQELSFHHSMAPNWFKSDEDSMKVYTLIKNFESHVLHLITELLNSIKIIPNIIYRKKIAVVRSYLNLLIVSRENKITPVSDGVPVMIYWDSFNKRLWKVVISSTALDPRGFRVQTLIENEKDRDDAIRNLQNRRVFFNSMSSVAKNLLCDREIKLLSEREIKDTYLFKIIQQ